MIEDYKSQATTTTIKASSKVSIKIKDTFYTLDFTEERALPPEIDTTNIAIEKELLWGAVHAQVDQQIQEILDLNNIGR